MHVLLNEVVDEIAERSVEVWRPALGPSRARTEATATAVLKRADGMTPWGTDPIETVWSASELLYTAVLEYARAAARLLVPPFRAWAPIAEVRAAVEAAAQVTWLSDPQVADGRTRIGMYYSLRLHSARQLEFTFDAVKPGGQLSDYGMPPGDVEAHAGMLALTRVVDKNSVTTGFEGCRVRKMGDLASLIVGDNGTYSMLSGLAHSELWALLQGYRGLRLSPLGISVGEQERETAILVAAVRACLQALLKPIDNACEMFDRPVLAGALSRVRIRVTKVMGE